MLEFEFQSPAEAMENSGLIFILLFIIEISDEVRHNLIFLFLADIRLLSNVDPDTTYKEAGGI